ncbi:chemotaxis protein CheD [Priestia koreensis]|uniref:chemotaxis protein CheD n=1 Tax=Priestia koreensis TaxID=284581 RepID=UPI001F595025|nr:chemotaxis protein CheD [Priestia koreensis]MCM3003749.1 chemotaxis protein CheD [Priestia koreensis]UNL83859.1 chemotaxis protein CheD [Priestia koreensis]
MLYDTNVIKVGISDMNIVTAPDHIRTSGLGSCVGVVIYDLHNRIAGLAHIMLPDSSLAKANELNVAKYADTAVTALVEELLRKGARKAFLKAKLAGGAQMFQFHSSNDLMRIGPRNVEAVEAELIKLHIPVQAKDVGGNNGRTIEFDPTSGILQIRKVHQGTFEI